MDAPKSTNSGTFPEDVMVWISLLGSGSLIFYIILFSQQQLGQLCVQGIQAYRAALMQAARGTGT